MTSFDKISTSYDVTFVAWQQMLGYFQFFISHLSLASVSNKMVFKEKLSPEIKAYIELCLKENKKSLRTIAKECSVGYGSVRRIAKNGLHSHQTKKKNEKTENGCRRGPGRPKKLTIRDQYMVVRNIGKLREVINCLH